MSVLLGSKHIYWESHIGIVLNAATSINAMSSSVALLLDVRAKTLIDTLDLLLSNENILLDKIDDFGSIPLVDNDFDVIVFIFNDYSAQIGSSARLVATRDKIMLKN